MITLYQFPASFGLPNLSPFCFKVENYLRMTGEPYEVKSGSPQRAPKGKLPFIKDGGVVISDSEHIVLHLKKTRGDKLDKDLTPQQRALGHLIRRAIEEALYFCLVYARWVDDAGFSVLKEHFFKEMPAIARLLVPGIARRMVKKQIRAQGTGRHAPEDIYAAAAEDISALSELLGEKPFFLGDSPSSVDASAYGFLAVMLWSPLPAAITDSVKKHANLVAYCERMKAKYYP
jgi:glutathione S-transferase